jgi:hypothetical protein
MQSALVVVITLAASIGITSPAARAAEWTKHWSVAQKPELRITAGDASLAVEVGSDREISASVRTRGVDIGERGLRITEHQEGNRVELEIREPSTHAMFGFRSVEVQLRVPRDLIADLHTGDGSIRLSGIHGVLRVYTGDGSIQGDDLDGALDARTGDGSLHVSGRFEDLKVRTSDGSVDVQAFQGSQMRSDWRVETGDGSVRLGLPRNLSANIQLRTGDGSIHFDVPLLVQGMRNEHQVEGKLNGGGPLLEVHTGDGSIHLGTI